MARAGRCACLARAIPSALSPVVAAVNRYGSLRDRTLLVLALHTGLRPEELCRLQPTHVHLGRRAGT